MQHQPYVLPDAADNDGAADEAWTSKAAPDHWEEFCPMPLARRLSPGSSDNGTSATTGEGLTALEHELCRLIVTMFSGFHGSVAVDTIYAWLAREYPALMEAVLQRSEPNQLLAFIVERCHGHLDIVRRIDPWSTQLHWRVVRHQDHERASVFFWRRCRTNTAKKNSGRVGRRRRRPVGEVWKSIDDERRRNKAEGHMQYLYQLLPFNQSSLSRMDFCRAHGGKSGRRLWHDLVIALKIAYRDNLSGAQMFYLAPQDDHIYRLF